jgi:hypothetical protein
MTAAEAKQTPVSDLTPYTIRFPNRNRPAQICEHEGFLVPDTNATLAVDERYPADNEGPACWYITHLPTGFRINKVGYTDAQTLERAVGCAQRFYRQCKAMGWDLTGADAKPIQDAMKAMSPKDRDAFWLAVAG